MRQSVVIKTEDEMREEMLASKMPRTEIDKLIIEHKENVERVQADYDTAPPSRPYKRSET